MIGTQEGMLTHQDEMKEGTKDDPNFLLKCGLDVLLEMVEEEFEDI